MTAQSINLMVKRAGPIGVLLVLFAICLGWLTFMRGVLVATEWARLQGTPELWRLFAMGARMDVIVLCELFAVPAVLLLMLPNQPWRDRLVAVVLTLCAGLLIHMELTTPAFLTEYDRRPDRIYYEYLLYPREVVGTLVKTYPLQLIVVAVLLVGLTYTFWRLCKRRMRSAASWPWKRRMLALPVMLVLLFIGIRSTFGHRPANMSTAAYSSNHLVNELAVSSTYSLLTAVYMSRAEVDTAKLYAPMSAEESLSRVRRYIGADAADYVDPAIPTLHRQPPPLSTPQSTKRPPNLVIVLLESLGADFVGNLGGPPLTPNIDRLSHEGLWFSQMYATGTRTARGLEAVVTGFPPSAAPPVLKLPASQRDFFTLPRLLKNHGYKTDFIYGGVSNFDNMGKFLGDNGVDRVIEQRDFENPTFLGTWGVSDEDLVAKAHDLFLAHGEHPFFALLLSTTNHVPFEFPEGRIELHEQPAATRNNAVKFTDYAVGKLFELARTAPYFKNTIFLVVADHDAKVFGADLVPVEHFHIPALIIGPGVPQRHETRLASQIDLAPTLLGLMGIDATHPMIGRDLLRLPPDVPGRALMQYGDANGFWVGDQIAIHQPHRPAQTFRYDTNRLVAIDHNVELEQDALAHLIWVDGAYRRREYRLPTARE